ncbi:hypothetical protein NEPAR06_0677 [Nematocida parisii]|nr:uncharacterized protein NEPG_02428 [Nematocida parisii ERTm1]EIJ92737.1 hypothetical protein NEPG_02428 [Nematocida parisii ERTm1]KAI5143052.1 hypothetical protein NEPAR07_0468 [Nematocida parisii]KAI5153719.1 hypothetical protein NEPAR06_0677 [Nematocida parisii]KAI5156168.1 hypothetical protein NEPAR05_0345 [Nematocida parisii]|eukprot:XP_013060255.1 hypothetical protein NEPG_02428 [Nematocida parisii ERTm1]
MGIMDKISEVAQHSEQSNKNKDKEKETGETTQGTAEKEEKKEIEKKANDVINRPSKDDVINTIAEKPKTGKSLKEKLISSQDVEVHRESTGVKGGLSISGSSKQTIDPTKDTKKTDENKSIGLINKESKPVSSIHTSALKGGLENKVGDKDINSGKISKPIESFNVAGGVGSGIADHIKSKKHSDLQGKQSKPIIVDTNSGKVEKKHKSHDSPDEEDTSVVEHSHTSKKVKTEESMKKSEESKKAEGSSDGQKESSNKSEQNAKPGESDALSIGTSSGLSGNATHHATNPSESGKPHTLSESAEHSKTEGAAAKTNPEKESSDKSLGAGIATAAAASTAANGSSAGTRDVYGSTASGNSTVSRETSVRNETSVSENERTSTHETTERTVTEKTAPITRTEAMAIGAAGAAVPLAAAGAVAASGNRNNAMENSSAQPAAGNGLARSESTTAGTVGQGDASIPENAPAPASQEHKAYETKPESSSDSLLTQDRDSGDLLYETDLYKKRYFLQFLWTKRHFTLSKDGIMKYYRNVNSKRRGEFDINEYFTSFKATEVKKGKYPYRISLVSDKSDDLGFETKEQRDEFLYWLDKAAE